MKYLFKPKALIQPTFFQKIFKIKPKGNFTIEINNLLAEKEILDISKEEIQSLSDTYKVNLQKNFQNDLLNFYKVCLESNLGNRELSEIATNKLNHLVSILNLNEIKTKEIFEEITRGLYKNVVQDSIRGGILEREDEIRLLNMEKNLMIPKDVATNIYKENAESILTSRLQKAISDQRFSPEEEEELNTLAKNLHIGLTFDSDTRSVLDKYKLFWEIDNGNIPVIVTDISLQKSELCYFNTDIDWLEQRTVTTRVNYGGPSFRVKIVKGLYYRVGSVSAQRITEDVWKTIDSGKLYLTNKRVIFMGSKGNKTITINKILDFNVFSNGIEIQKDSGKSPFFEFNNNTDVFAVILAKLLMEK